MRRAPLHLEAGAAGEPAPAWLALYGHDGKGWPLGQTLLHLAAEDDGIVLRSSSDSMVSLTDERAICGVTLTPQADGGVAETFEACTRPSGNGTVRWTLTGTRLKAGS